MNAELKACNRPILQNPIVDTLLIARQKFPGAKNNLDVLCERFHVDASRRTVHGALLDSELLADVYFELITKRELDFTENNKVVKNQTVIREIKTVSRETFPIREWQITPEEEKAHQEFLTKIKGALWDVS